MNFEELWIGDLVHVKHLETNGKFEGVEANGKVKVRLGFNVHYFEKDDLTEAVEESEENSILFDNKLSVPKYEATFSSKELDLHIEKLNPRLQHQTVEQIVHYQISKCEAFIRYAIDRRWAKILIIHGKGTGVLKQEVEHIVKGFVEVSYSLEKNNGGALEVWFQYY